MYPPMSYLFWSLLLLFILYSVLSSYFGIGIGIGKTMGGDGHSNIEGFSGSKLIDYKKTYKIISTERLDDADKYSDVPEKGEAIKFITENKKTFIINPITKKPFYIHHNFVTIRVKSIENNSFPENSLIVTVSAKCKKCHSVTNWNIYISSLTKE